MDLIELLNSPEHLTEINKLLTPFKYDSEKGSHIIAAAIHKWSNNMLPPVLWSGAKDEPAFWGLLLLCKDHGQPYGEESKIFFAPSGSAIDNKQFKTPGVWSTAGWPNYKNKGHSCSRYDQALYSKSWLQLNDSQHKRVLQLIDFLHSHIGEFQLSKECLIDSYLNNAKNNHQISNTTAFDIVTPVKAGGKYHARTRRVWHIGGAPELSYSIWPRNMTAEELVSYIKESVTNPENPRLVVLNIRLYLRANKIKLSDSHWEDIATVFSTCDYIAQPVLAVKGIKNLPVPAQVAWLASLIEGRRKLTPEVLDYIDQLQHPHFEQYIPKSGSKINNPMLSPEGEVYAAIRIVRDYKNKTGIPDLTSFKTPAALLYIAKNLAEMHKRFDWTVCSSDQLRYFYASNINTVTKLKAMTLSELVHNINPDDWSDKASEDINKALLALQRLILHAPPADKAGFLLKDLGYYLERLDDNINKYYDAKASRGEYIDLKEYKDVVFNIVTPKSKNIDMPLLLSLHDNKWDACTVAWRMHYHTHNDVAQPLPTLEFD